MKTYTFIAKLDCGNKKHDTDCAGCFFFWKQVRAHSLRIAEACAEAQCAADGSTLVSLFSEAA